MNKKRILIPIVAGLLVSTIPYRKTHADALHNALLVGATLTGACVLAHWLSEPTDQDLIRNAQATNTHATLSYASFLTTFESLYAINTRESSLEQKQQVVDLVSEENLSVLAKQFFGTGRQTIHAYVQGLNDSINLIEKHIHLLSKRMHSLTQKNKSTTNDYQAMHHAREQLNQTAIQLRFIHTYVKNHTSYFYLYELEEMLRARYTRELNLNTAYPIDRIRFQEELRISVMLRAHCQEHPGYLYQEYIRILANDIDTLFTRITRLAFAYHDRINECQSLAHALTAIKNSIIADPEYARSIANYHVYLQQEARLAAEREHIRMEHERACLERERARIEREKMLQLEEQNRILREQNRIKERELYEAQREKTEVVVVTTHTTETSAPPAYEEVIDDSGCYY